MKQEKIPLNTFLNERADYMACHRTKGESNLELFLIRENINFDTQRPIVTPDGKGYIADFLIPDSNIIIEVDGGYHTTKEQQIYDKKRDEDLTKMGYTVIRVTNEQTKMLDGKFYQQITVINPFKKKKNKKRNYRLEAKERKRVRKEFFEKKINNSK